MNTNKKFLGLVMSAALVVSSGVVSASAHSHRHSEYKHCDLNSEHICSAADNCLHKDHDCNYYGCTLTCSHLGENAVHDENCGYNPKTNTPCSHLENHSDSCYVITKNFPKQNTGATSGCKTVTNNRSRCHGHHSSHR